MRIAVDFNNAANHSVGGQRAAPAASSIAFRRSATCSFAAFACSLFTGSSSAARKPRTAGCQRSRRHSAQTRWEFCAASVGVLAEKLAGTSTAALPSLAPVRALTVRMFVSALLRTEAVRACPSGPLSARARHPPRCGRWGRSSQERRRGAAAGCLSCPARRARSRGWPAVLW